MQALLLRRVWRYNLVDHPRDSCWNWTSTWRKIPKPIPRNDWPRYLGKLWNNIYPHIQPCSGRHSYHCWRCAVQYNCTIFDMGAVLSPNKGGCWVRTGAAGNSSGGGTPSTPGVARGNAGSGKTRDCTASARVLNPELAWPSSFMAPIQRANLPLNLTENQFGARLCTDNSLWGRRITKQIGN
jgi:hypothetical protein